MATEYPFLYGAQYYRAPTPQKKNWENDLRKMHEMGFNCVKFWVQWRWSHREENEFYFEDLDELMNLAEKYHLRVTLNIICDVSPVWLYEKYPNAMQVTSSGVQIIPVTIQHRQIGGFPGPCYNHLGALGERRKFIEATVKHFANHPALSMWDVWNEPEQCGIYREAKFESLVCFCDSCKKGFLEWLNKKYGKLDKLNEVWGRCYIKWEEVELPRSGSTIVDFIDFREFQLDTMTIEAKWRLEMTKKFDGKHISYLHVVPNNMRIFNSVTCVDDFALAKECDVFASTLLRDPLGAITTISAANEKICYNVECHIANGSINMHQKMVTLHDLLKDLLPQIGMGIKGFMYWQYRPECLGTESPAWGLVKEDGSEREITKAVFSFWEQMKTYSDLLMNVKIQEPQIAVWKSRKNELFYFACGNANEYVESIEAYVNFFYWNNYPCKVINEENLENGLLDNVKFLVCPSCYYVTEQEAEVLNEWIKNGGVMLCEAHFAGYNSTTGRHSEIIPGYGLDKLWGIKETESSSSFHLNYKNEDNINSIKLNDDVQKALSVYGMEGGKFFPIKREDNSLLFGAQRYAELEADNYDTIGKFNEQNIIVKKPVGNGFLVYSGTNIGQGAHNHKEGFQKLMNEICDFVDIKRTLSWNENSEMIHIDVLKSQESEFLVINNKGVEQEINITVDGKYIGVFSKMNIEGKGEAIISLPENFIDIFVAI